MLTSFLRASTAAVVGLAIFHGSVSQANAAPPPGPGGRPGGMPGQMFPSRNLPGRTFGSNTPSFATFWPNGRPFWRFGWPGYGYGYYWPAYEYSAYQNQLAAYQYQANQTASALVLQEQLRLAQQRNAYNAALRSSGAPMQAEKPDRLTIAQVNPASKDIRSAQALNELLVDLQKYGVAELDAALNQKDLKKINVTTGSGRDQAIFNFLQTERTQWPAFLQDPKFAAERAELTRLSAEAIDEVMNGSHTTDASKELRRKADELYERLDGLNAGDAQRPWMEARGFVRRYSTAARALQQPDARDYLLGKFTLQGNTVGELVNHMTTHGLRFAADAGDNQAAYRAIHRALADSSIAVHGGNVVSR